MEERKQVVITKIQEKQVLLYMEGDTLFDVLTGEDDSPETVSVGDIYVGKIQNIVYNINAAFVEVKPGALCYLPLWECQEGPPQCGDELIVQVKKTAVKSKRAVVTRHIEVAGRFAVISTKNSEKGISKKIQSEEAQSRLSDLLREFEEEEYGIILRTNAEKADEDEVRKECQALLSDIYEILEKGQYMTCFSLLRKEEIFYRKYLNSCRISELDRIITDDEEVYRELEPLYGAKIQFYRDDSCSLDHLLGISSKLKNGLEKRVWLKSGANLVIEPTEALTVIDVNTGKAIEGKRNKETTFFKINCEGAREAARQIRLRNLSGIIVIDFIDMQKKENQEKLMALLRKLLERDPTRANVIDITKLGLVEITRMKKNRPLWEVFSSF